MFSGRPRHRWASPIVVLSVGVAGACGRGTTAPSLAVLAGNRTEAAATFRMSEELHVTDSREPTNVVEQSNTDGVVSLPLHSTQVTETGGGATEAGHTEEIAIGSDTWVSGVATEKPWLHIQSATDRVAVVLLAAANAHQL